MEDAFGNDLTTILTEEQRASLVCELERAGDKCLPRLKRSDGEGRLAGQWVEAKGKMPACISFSPAGTQLQQPSYVTLSLFDLTSGT